MFSDHFGWNVEYNALMKSAPIWNLQSSKAFLKWLQILPSYSSTPKRSFIVRFVMESFKDYLGMLNTDLILAHYKLDSWKIIPTLGNKLVFSSLFAFSGLHWKQIKSPSQISGLDLSSPTWWNSNLELCLKSVRDFKNSFLFWYKS